MKIPKLIHAAALIAAVATTFVLVHSIALLALPPHVPVLQIAHAAMSLTPA